jgi:hypothetical protein
MTLLLTYLFQSMKRILKSIQERVYAAFHNSCYKRNESDDFQQSEPLIQCDKFIPHSQGLPKNLATTTHVTGGICTMGGRGGKGCKEGGVHKKTNPTTDSTEIIYGPVHGGCSNCRYFFTGPNFITDQVNSLNNLLCLLKNKSLKQKDQSIEPLIIDWYNRYEFLRKTKRIMANTASSKQDNYL